MTASMIIIVLGSGGVIGITFLAIMATEKAAW